jgi:hypothetical protein
MPDPDRPGWCGAQSDMSRNSSGHGHSKRTKDTEVDIAALVREIKEIHEHFLTWTQDNVFVPWFLQAFLVADAEMAARSVTGVSHDKGVDGVYIDESIGLVFILQGKFHQGSKPPLESRSDVIAFAQLARKLRGAKHE